MVVEDLVRGGVDGSPRLLRGWTIIQSSSSSFESFFGGLPRRLGADVVVDDVEVVFVEDFVSGFDNVVFLGRPRLLGRASVGGVALETGFSRSIVTVSVLSPS